MALISAARIELTSSIWASTNTKIRGDPQRAEHSLRIDLVQVVRLQ